MTDTPPNSEEGQPKEETQGPTQCGDPEPKGQPRSRWLGSSPEDPLHITTDNDKRYSDQKEYQNRQLSIQIAANWIGSVLGAAAIASLVLLTCTVQEARRANGLAKAAVDQAHMDIVNSERPWIGVKLTDLSGYGPRQVTTLTAELNNFGKSPGIILSAPIHMTMTGPRPTGPVERADAPRDSLYAGGGLLFPNQQMLKVIRYPISKGSFESLESGASSFIVWGSITYRDTGDRIYTSEFCAFMNVELTTRGFGFCPKGNNAYEGYPREPTL